MFFDYRTLVLDAYNQKRVRHFISQRLINPTPAKLKEECLAVCTTRFSRKDQNALEVFFGPAEDQKSCLQAISKCDIDRFKPLANFLKKKTTETEDKNIELLAWLIDFSPRPYELGRKYCIDEAVETDTGGEDREGVVQKENKIVNASGEVDSPEPLILSAPGGTEAVASSATLPMRVKISQHPLSINRFSWVVLIGVIMAIAVGIVYHFVAVQSPPLRFTATGPQSCMYWAGDHFQQVSCNQKMPNTTVIALDSEKIIHFKKITRCDTLTEKALGYVWYSKINGKVVFYTSNGDDPEKPQYRLHPATLYMINKYARLCGE